MLRELNFSGFPFPSPGDLPDPGNKPRSPALQEDALPSELLGKPREIYKGSQIIFSRTEIPWTVACQAPLSMKFKDSYSLEGKLSPTSVQFSSIQLLSCVWFFGTPRTAVCLASTAITNFRSLFKLTSIKLVMPSNHLILCHPLFLLPSIFPNIRVFSNESALHIRWPKYWSFSFSICPSNDYSGLISFRLTGLISLQSKGLSRVFSSTTVQNQQFFSI